MVNNKKVAAIIAEYNPFHNGHEYHIKKTREKTGADYILILMSGNFVQRGEPAIIDRYERAKACLHHGADAVFELPVTVSTSSSEIFAKGAVSLATKLGIVDYLSFGAECEDITELISCSDTLKNIPNLDFEIKNLMSNGLTYPEARSLFLEQNNYKKEAKLLSGSNNILGISYLLSLSDLSSEIEPIAIKRKAVSHNAETPNHVESIASAKSIRNWLIEKKSENVSSFLPYFTDEVLKKKNNFIHKDDFSDILSAKLGEIIFSKSKKEAIHTLSQFHDVTSDLASRIYNLYRPPLQYSEFAASLWSKNHTYSRIDRVLFHIILGITKELIDKNNSYDYCPYIRPLAIKEEALELLKGIDSYRKVPLITRIGDFRKIDQKTAEYTFQLNRYSAALYTQIYSSHHGSSLHDETKHNFMMIL